MRTAALACLLILLVVGGDFGSAEPGRRRGRNRSNRRGGPSNNQLKRFSEEVFALRSPTVFRNVGFEKQGKGTSCNRDNARQNLFNVSDINQIYGSETVQALIPLLDNYDPDVRKPEVVTSLERMEMQIFMDAVLSTPEMEAAYNFLTQNGLFSGGMDSFKAHVTKLWTGLFDNDSNRNTDIKGSSGFEHVFVGEVKRGKVSGQHNWVQMYLQEKTGHFNYKGYAKTVAYASDVTGLKMNYEWNGDRKCGGSVLVGSTPELEMALATVCFKARPNASCPLKLGNKNIAYKTYSFRYRGYNYLGTAYPEI